MDLILEQTSVIPLINDLDLGVISKEVKIYIGNHLESEKAYHFSTYEKVILKNGEIDVGKYGMHIYSNNFIDISLSKLILRLRYSLETVITMSQ